MEESFRQVYSDEVQLFLSHAFYGWFPYLPGKHFLIFFLMLYYALLCSTILCYTILCSTILCYALLYYAMLYYTMLCSTMLCYTMLCYALLCFAMLWMSIPHKHCSPWWMYEWMNVFFYYHSAMSWIISMTLESLRCSISQRRGGIFKPGGLNYLLNALRIASYNNDLIR